MAQRIAALEAELSELRQQQRDELVTAIAVLIGPGVVFSVKDLLAHAQVHPALAAAFSELHIQSPKQLGKQLRACCGGGLVRVGQNNTGILWMVEVDFHFHQASFSARGIGVY